MTQVHNGSATAVDARADTEIAEASPPTDDDRDGGYGVFLKAALKVAAPTSFVTALLFYFGWARAQAALRVLGLHESLMDYSVSDLVLRSVSALFVPLGLLACTVAAIGLLHHHADSLARTARQRRLIEHSTYTAILLGAALIVFGTVAVLVPEAAGNVRFVTPLALLGGLTIIGMCVMVRRVTGLVARTKPLPHAVVAGFGALVVLAVFYATADYAAWIGTLRAERLITSASSLPDVSLLSTQALHIDEPTVHEETLDSTSGYRYRYTGLRLLIRTKSHYIFLHDDFDLRSGTTILVPIDDVQRLDIVR